MPWVPDHFFMWTYYNIPLEYSRFHKTLPNSSLQMHGMFERFYEKGVSKTSYTFEEKKENV